MERQLWHNFGVFLLISNTVGILALLETIIFRVPYITIFLVMFGILVYLNLKLFKVNNLFGKKIL